MVISFFSARVGLGSGRAVPVVPVAVLTSLLVLGAAFILGPARGAVVAAPALFGVAGLAVSRRSGVGAFGRAATGAVSGAAVAVVALMALLGPAARFHSGLLAPQDLTVMLTDDVRVGGGNWVRADGRAVSVRNRDGAQAAARGWVQLWWNRTAEDRTGRFWSGQTVTVRVRSWQPPEAVGPTRFFAAGPPSEASTLSPFQRLRATVFDGARRRLRRAEESITSFVLALTLADKTDLDVQLVAAFREAGASHALALSGMHLGILATMVALLIRPLIGRRWSRRVVLPILIVYVATVGLLASLLRAIVGALLIWMLAELDLRTRPATVVSAALLPILLFVPRMVLEVGLWLSFAALLGLVTLGPLVTRALSRWLPPTIALAIGASWAAFVATAPISLLVFGTVYPAGILAAAPIGIGITIFAWTSLIALSAATVPWVGLWAIQALTIQYRALLAGAEWCSRFNGGLIGILLVMLPGLAVLYHSVRVRRATILSA